MSIEEDRFLFNREIQKIKLVSIEIENWETYYESLLIPEIKKERVKNYIGKFIIIISLEYNDFSWTFE